MFRLLSALSLCLWFVAFEICLYSRFKGVFGGFPLLDVCLYCSRALRGLCGFCVREWLGGFMACGVFAPVFHLLPISFCLSFLLLSSCPAFALLSCLASCLACFPALCVVFLSSCLVLFVLVSLWLLSLFPFPFRYIRKKGRKFLRPLLSCCRLC